ncbi:MAG: hypothetical protein EBT36_07520 [Betaproteobacteria bacterium]|jgi:hypothetical protein|nr:hypothetical protein [Betaproteobacteria bacterium]NBP35261.1 hypothetical protein [Betaproteobacteria bacterium]NBQ78371.1 hypothetical protein [Betaproteobacteria bacterium]NBS38959.1 hypothetical protein [Betaproteobacteria bacterium]NBT71238.1 hypothetical protein [Betaproteobacteria bacterium]
MQKGLDETDATTVAQAVGIHPRYASISRRKACMTHEQVAARLDVTKAYANLFEPNKPSVNDLCA